MPLPSSGNQIALSQIRNEFSLGSGQIAMSQLYGRGNAPASSGAIQCGGHFHGVSAEVVLLQTTVTSGTRVRDAKVDIQEFGYSDGTGTGGDTYGSIATATYTQNGVTRTVKVCRSNGSSNGGNASIILAISGTSYTGWTSLTVTRGSSSGTILRTNMNSTNSGATIFDGNIGVSGLFATNQQTTIKIVE